MEDSCRDNPLGYCSFKQWICTWLQQYKAPTIFFCVLIAALVISFFSNINSDLKTLVSTIIGLLFSIPVSLLWLKYKTPILQITEKMELGNEISINESFSTIPFYKPLIITVENIGRSSAINCKGYFIDNKKKTRYRVCWTVKDERPNATINVKDHERLDLFGFYLCPLSDKIICCPSENGWIDNVQTIDSGPSNIYSILITSENAQPVERKFIIDFPNQKIQFVK